LKKSKIEEAKDLKFEDSTRVCDSSRVSGATDIGMPFGYPRIRYRVWPIMKMDYNKDSRIDLETKKKGSNPYSTRTLVKPSLVAYIKPGRDDPRGTTYNIEHHREIQDTR
jgi:hypothetical protein